MNEYGIFFGGEARLFGGEASPPPPVDETLIQYIYTAYSAVVRIQNEYETFVKHPRYLSVSAVGLYIMLPPPVSLMMS